MGQPIDVARAVAFLVSDEAGFINNCVVPVEGGTSALPPW
jgi:NAD(P)-dependent dehydrogenase (short-subunit alcohol dehydrogenase family)